MTQPDKCAWCNNRPKSGEGLYSGGELICEDCLQDLHGDEGWDRTTP